MIPQPLAACAHASWYPKFEKISIRSIPIRIPSDVQKYLLDDPIILPRECDSCLPPAASCPFSDDDSVATEQPEFPAFSSAIRNAIATLGGSVFLKTNWQSPKDAFWITAGQTLRVRDIADAYQLLKASSCTKEDVGRPIEPQLLVVRQWMDIHPGTEFRCYVKDASLIGKTELDEARRGTYFIGFLLLLLLLAISPRDWPQFHGHIPLQKREIISDIRSMFLEHIKHKFPLDSCELKKYYMIFFIRSPPGSDPFKCHGGAGGGCGRGRRLTIF